MNYKDNRIRTIFPTESRPAMLVLWRHHKETLNTSTRQMTGSVVEVFSDLLANFRHIELYQTCLTMFRHFAVFWVNYNSFLRTVDQENLKLLTLAISRAYFTSFTCASKRSFTCTLKSKKEIWSLLVKKATEKARVKSFWLPIANFKIDQFAQNECKWFSDYELQRLQVRYGFSDRELVCYIPLLRSSNWKNKHEYQKNDKSKSRTFCLLCLEYGASLYSFCDWEPKNKGSSFDLINLKC